VICMNKIDLDKESQAEAVLPRYAQLGYITLLTSVVTGQGVAALRDVLKDKASVIVGQSGVGKSSLLNVVQPGLELKVGDIMEHIGKGRHTTSTASLIRLKVGGYVVDTPGIRTLDLSTVPRNEFEMFFTEFIRHVEGCKFSDCTHTHEDACTVKRAVDTGQIHPDRYESYVRLFEELG
ncbi:MAG: ribosome small subunit-dependent GTPase A, partial [Planctomycetes bacterium]|nr:ribosome small subunit-dependent GTPase A [Planctomycetota bacterium]